MAIFLSRIKKALNLGTKNITVNGTYNASSDGYDGYSSVEVNVAGVTPTPVTPSNASPAALTSGTAVSPTGNGYAIESYSTVTPQEGLSYQLVSGSFVKMNGSGYGIKDFTQITPSNAIPVSLSSNKFYKASASGYAISSYSSKTPSDSSPASVSSGAIIKASASGYLYASSGLGKCKVGTFTASTSTTTTVTLGFKPKYLCVQLFNSGMTYYSTNTYNYDADSSNIYNIYKTGSAGGSKNALGNTSSNILQNVTNTGFIMNKITSTYSTTAYYIAIG